MSTLRLWLTWICGTLLVGAWLIFSLPTADSARESSTVFLPGDTTHGHYQIEMKCSACHEPGGEVREQSCMECHAKDLKLARDTHPASKFSDPQKAELLLKVDATKCITCHKEHVPAQTNKHGVTLPLDYCVSCHDDVADDRPSHSGMSFMTCTNTGCHNYHDNSALYENFLMKHAEQPDVLDNPHTPLTQAMREPKTDAFDISRALGLNDLDAPPDHDDDARINRQWHQSTHALAGVNCSDCHSLPTLEHGRSGEASQNETSLLWSNSVSHEACATCHKPEVSSFLKGLHGMRLASGLPAMSPSDARLPMKQAAGHRSLTCASCHQAHSFDRTEAAVESCLSCHNDQHSVSYKKSHHYQLWLDETSGRSPAGSGVSCATCHMPRVPAEQAGLGSSDDHRVMHNQSWNLAPIEKMARSACMNCHGLEYTLNALADETLSDACYQGDPKASVQSIEMVRQWFKGKRKKSKSN